MKSLRNGVNNLFDNMHMQIKIYREFYHGVIYIANERRHVRTYYTTLHNPRGTILCPNINCQLEIIFFKRTSKNEYIV
jgi:hypothetical protein